MQIPKRKPGKFTNIAADPLMTQEKFFELQRTYEKLKAARPHAASEVSRLAQLGDFSENAEYQLAKGRLRWMNDELARLEFQIDHAQIIQAGGGDTVQIGSTVVVEVNGVSRTFTILGSSETDPSAGIISYTSPIGAALVGHRVGDKVVVNVSAKASEYIITAIK